MTKRNIIIAVTAVLAVTVAVTAIITVRRKKNGDRITEPEKTSSGYSETVSNNNGNETANSTEDNTDIINVGKDVEEEKEELELEQTDDTSKGNGSKNSISSSGTGTSSGGGSASKTDASKKPDSTDKSKDSMTGWSAWE